MPKQVPGDPGVHDPAVSPPAPSGGLDGSIAPDPSDGPGEVGPWDDSWDDVDGWDDVVEADDLSPLEGPSSAPLPGDLLDGDVDEEPYPDPGVFGRVRRSLGVLLLGALLLGGGGAGVGYLLGRAAPVDGSGPEHASSYVVRTVGETSPRWDPCVPVRFVLVSQGAPPGAEVMVRDVLSELSGVTGLDLELQREGTPSPSDSAPDPVSVAWVVAADWDRDHRDALGLATVSHSGGRYLTGSIQLARSRDLSLDRWRVVLLHEVGHVLGLEHTADPSQVMAAQVGSVTALGSGDLAGLRLVGGTCPSPAPPSVALG